MTSWDWLFGIRVENTVHITCVFNAKSTSTKTWAVGYVVGTEKNRLNETVLLSTQNICLNRWVRKYLQFYAEFVYLNLWVPLHVPLYLLTFANS